MEVVFLGTGSAWGAPEHGCPCLICQAMRRAGEERTRTSLLVTTDQHLLIDPGPDIRRQMIDHRVGRPDAVLITHEHLDHMGGLDDLLCFRRSVARQDWRPIPVYAHPAAWPSIEARFDYLFETTLEKRDYLPGRPAEDLAVEVTPFKTEHGPVAKGSVGLIIARNGKKLVYTSDFMSLPEEPEALAKPDLLILQAHFFNEPGFNRPHHMSLQNGLDYIARWEPKRVVLVHLSSADWTPGDPANAILKKLEPKDPLRDEDGRPFDIPLTTDDWAALAPRVLAAAGLDVAVEPAREGMRLVI